PLFGPKHKISGILTGVGQTRKLGGRVMYFNVLGEKISRARYREMMAAAKNRRELIAAGLTSRRDLLKMGLLTTGGMLVAKRGLRPRPQPGGSNTLCVPSQQAASPPTRA